MRRLIVNPDTENAWEISLQPGVFSVGRNLENQIPLEHDSVSGEHCLLKVTDAGVVVKDLGSTGGTFVNEAPADETVLLPGQTLRLGDVVLRFEADSPPVGETATPAAGSAASATYCKIHREAIAHFHCPHCRWNFCDICVSMRHGGIFCRACGGECERLAPAAVSDGNESSFFSLAPGAFLYPVQGDGIVLLAAGTVFFLLIDGAQYVLRFSPGYGWIVLVMLVIFGIGYLTVYLRGILTGTAMGENRMPDWPEFTDFGSFSSPFFQLVGTVVFSFGPVIALRAYAAVVTESSPWLGEATTAAIAFGCAYFPIAFLAVAMFDSVGAVNPLLIVSTILTIPLEYLFAVGLFAVVLFMYWLGRAFLPEILPIPLLPAVLSGFLGLYLLTVEVRILGLLYRTKRNKLAWFRQ